MQQLLHQTMLDAVVLRVQRNRYDLLYKQYTAKRDFVDAEAGEKHERWLWNGQDHMENTMQTGFDLRYASREFNKYGVGVYFAADARLAAFFQRSTRENTGQKQLILARVALGTCKERPAVPGYAVPVRGDTRVNPELLKPEWTLPPPGAQSATSCHRIEAIVYENHQAFPHYLVTYTAGPRTDPYSTIDPPLKLIDNAPVTSDIDVHNGKVKSFVNMRHLHRRRDQGSQQRDKSKSEGDGAVFFGVLVAGQNVWLAHVFGLITLPTLVFAWLSHGLLVMMSWMMGILCFSKYTDSRANIFFGLLAATQTMWVAHVFRWIILPQTVFTPLSYGLLVTTTFLFLIIFLTLESSFENVWIFVGGSLLAVLLHVSGQINLPGTVFASLLYSLAAFCAVLGAALIMLMCAGHKWAYPIDWIFRRAQEIEWHHVKM